MEEQMTNVETNMKEENKEKKGGGKVVLTLIFILCVLGIAFMAFKKITTKKEVDKTELPSVNVTYIRKGSIKKETQVMGNILPNDTYFVPVKVGGDIKKIYVKNGDHVKKGDPICEIDASKEIDAAFIQYDTAKSSYERMQKLYAAGDISKQSFETVKAQYDSYKLVYDTKVEYATPVAVADGVIENTDMILNTSVKAEKVLCYITSKDAKEINFGVTERVLQGIKLGDKVKIEKNGKTYDGYISNVANLIDASTGLFKIKAVITSENNFASGIMAKVSFVYEKKDNVNILPNDMIYYEAGNAYIFVVDNDGLVTKKYIDVGLENDNTTEILTDLDRDLKIVSTWNNDLAEGAYVKVNKEERVDDEYTIESEANKIIAEKEKKDLEKEYETEVVISTLSETIASFSEAK